MKKFIFLIILFLSFSCSANKGVYWCGDHPCINKDEKEAYFKKNMIVEVKNYNKKNIKKDSEIEKIINQAKLNEKKRKLGEKESLKRKKIEEKELMNQKKLEEKKRRNDEKELIKKLKLEEKKRKNEEKELIKQLKLEEKQRKSKKKSYSNRIKDGKKKVKKTKKITNGNKIKKDLSNKNVEIATNNFEDLVKNIIKRNSSRSYPEINDIPK